ncbi:MAG TPA: type II secretion system protein, partial [Lacipirellulaceae bacterium]
MPTKRVQGYVGAASGHRPTGRSAHVGESLRDSHETLGCALRAPGPKDAQAFSIHPRLGETRLRGFTLVELLVVIAIIST